MKRGYLRASAIALILLPEPFTTPLGMILLLFSFVLPKRHKDSFKNLEDIVRRYRNYNRNNRFDYIAYSRRPVVFHQLNRNIPAKINIMGNVAGTTSNRLMRASKVKPDGVTIHRLITSQDYTERKIHSEFQYNFSTSIHKVNDKIIHHVLHTSIPRHDLGSTPPDQVTHHILKTTIVQPPPKDVFYSRLRPLGPIIQPQKVVHHSLKLY